MKRGGIPNQGKQGQAPHVPTAETRMIVRRMMAGGFRWQEIAKNMLDIDSHHTLRKYYAEEMKLGREECLFDIGQGAMKKALSGDNDMTKFCLLTKGGWKMAKDEQASTVTNVVINANPKDD